MEREMPELLPCPFCGGRDLKFVAVKSEDPDEVGGILEYARAVFCSTCHARGRHNCAIGWTESDLAAAEAWNDRLDKGSMSIVNLPESILEPCRQYIQMERAFDEGKTGGSRSLALLNLAACAGERLIEEGRYIIGWRRTRT